MERLIDRAVYAVMCIASVIGIVVVLLPACTASEVQAETPQRFSVENVAHNYGECIDVFVISDSETGDKWLLVEDTSLGDTSIDVEPLEVGQ